MKYFIDTEFIEGFHKPLFGKRRHFIDLISIGIVCEDGRTSYMISSEYEYNDADQWVKENVILPLYLETVGGDARNRFTVSNFHKHFGFKNSVIAHCIEGFVLPPEHYNKMFGKGSTVQPPYHKPDPNPEFYAYYADYDWVVFCSLFGRMIDLPKGFPMYCRDLKQMLDKEVEFLDSAPEQHEHWKWLPDKSWLENVKAHYKYPKQENEHSALDDAKWNFELYKFLVHADFTK